MYFIYSIVLAVGFVLMAPLFLLRREKYTAGFSERLGNYPFFEHDGRKIVWLHCVSVGEANAARPLVDAIKASFPYLRIVVSTTTRTGQELAKKIFSEKADAIFYFPFDFKFSIRRALDNFRPSIVLLLETEIWPRFIREAKARGSAIALVNGRLSERSIRRYSNIRPFISRVLADVDLAAMQGEKDRDRLVELGFPAEKTKVTGNLKFDLGPEFDEEDITCAIAKRFSLERGRPLIIAASTHDPEESWLLEAYCSVANGAVSPRPRLMIVPRHPERFEQVAKTVQKFRNDAACEWSRYTFVRRSEEPTMLDADADIILLDSIGELRAVYPLAEIVFVGGSLIPHGGQSVLEPAAAGKAIVTGPFTHNFADAIAAFRNSNGIVQLPELPNGAVADELFSVFCDLFEDDERRQALGRNAASVMSSNRGATARTVEYLNLLFRIADR